MSKAGPAKYFKDQLTRNHVLVEQLSAADFPYPVFSRLQDWQRERLRTTYADLFAQDRYREALIFFLEELYGGKDIARRDHDVGRVYPVMVRFLPAETLTAVGDAFQLQAVSLELDMAMSRNWLAAENRGELDQERYCDLYRRTGCLELRDLQIELIGSLGLDLAAAVDNSMVDKLVRVLRLPAKIAGFESLQLFLESGLHAFRILGDPEEFLQTICSRERYFKEEILAGNPRPFTI
jgi:hypothetical protein